MAEESFLTKLYSRTSFNQLEKMRNLMFKKFDPEDRTLKERADCVFGNAVRRLATISTKQKMRDAISSTNTASAL